LSLLLASLEERSSKDDSMLLRTNALENDKDINVMTDTTVKFVEGEMGSFTLHYSIPDDEDGKTLQTSAVVLATGFQEFKPTMMDEYHQMS
jgi:lysine/ornithine N-monooxygenase